ncbi:hypothetical protein K8Z61_07790 [Nocardioides sp. TRM66260-LWL]|uniref:hypothetical protein n=1 Tax=Nocardioides sp. TRM66260-LWL TaxID=2874478 RepID=UPI001CC7E8A7|nr:hypothetical protein [Nocardioides sp. TRM66260-LWL]MBZ5734396.1 hypothetical protein [Nocardioides sp. TRM66260-LWL]
MRIGCIRPRATTRGGRLGVVTTASGLLTLLAALVAIGLPVGASPASARSEASEAVTVDAPGAGDRAQVTVSRTTGLVNESVSVSWTGFRPSSASRLANSGDSLDINTQNPVRVYQCRGAAPASSSDCYGSPGFLGIDASPGSPAIPAVRPFTYPGQDDAFDATPDGPANWQDNVTRADGSGEVTLQVFTKRESASLGCDADRPCSIVVVPNYGREGTGNGATEDQMDAPWAWARRTVVPLSFLPVGDACPLTGTSLRVEGSPFSGDLLASWRARTCTLDTDPVRLDFTSVGEPQVRQDLATGTTGVGLTIDPLTAEQASPQAVTYAPLAVTGLVVAFQIDDASGRPITDLRLNARLVAKLITGSYRSGGNPAVLKNPVNVFRDPELKALNPGIAFPSGAPGNHPLLLGDLSDSTVALTRWLASDREARDFLAGKPDPWGMTVNANYRGLALPFARYPALDALMSETFEPIQELDAVARQLSIARFPGATTSIEDGKTVVTKPPRQNPGRREVIGIIDAASAARFRLSTASLRNTAGEYVKPTTASLLAGVEHAVTGADGVTRSVDLASTAKDVYPLMLQITGGFSRKAPKADRQEMADLLAYAGGAGQVPGEQVGQLPAGYAPLPAALRRQVTTARKAVLAGVPSAPDPTGDPTGDPTTGSSTSPVPLSPSSAPLDGGGGVPIAPVGATTGSTAPGAAAAPGVPGASASASSAPGTTTAQTLAVGSTPATGRMLLLPTLLGLALVLLVLGPAVLWATRTGRGPQWLRR